MCVCIVWCVVHRERQRKRKKKWGNFNRYEKNQVNLLIMCINGRGQYYLLNMNVDVGI